MYVTNVRNVCEALPTTIDLISKEGIAQDSRAGPVLVLPAPLMTATQHPRERVLRSAARDANPFFHMVEAIWMLAGREDAATLNLYVRDFGKRYAERQLGDPLPEENGDIHDAYGRRWRVGLGFDQIKAVVKRLIEDPLDRQCVIAMWDPRPLGQDDLLWPWRTRPCNTHIYLRVRDGFLDLTVCCRSNDMIWGGHGANAVHFSILQEYLAALIDVDIGKMYQLSNNAHVYMSELERLDGRRRKNPAELGYDHYRANEVVPEPMFIDPTAVDEDIMAAMHWHDQQSIMAAMHWHDQQINNRIPAFSNDWFSTTFVPAVVAYRAHRATDTATAIEIAKTIRAPDWRISCVEWLQRKTR